MFISYYGIDFHVNKFTYHVIMVDKNGEILKRETNTLYLEELQTKLLNKLTKNDYACIEAISGAFAFAKVLKKYIKDVFVVNPFDFKEIACSSKKNDKIDAKKLANKLKYHIEANDPDDNFPEVFIPEEKVRELRSLFTTYNLLKKQVIQIKNRVHSILKDNLILYDSDSENLFSNLTMSFIESLNINLEYKKQLKILEKQLCIIENNKNDLKNEIKNFGYNHFQEEIEILTRIKGVSFFIACAIMADLADIKRFKTANKFVSYMRCSPRLDSSNDKIYNGKIDKKGRKLAFSLLLQGLPHIIKSNINFSDFYNRKINGKSKGKVRSALIRKTFKTIYYLLKNKDVYRYCDEKNYNNKIKEIKKLNKSWVFY